MKFLGFVPHAQTLTPPLLKHASNMAPNPAFSAITSSGGSGVNIIAVYCKRINDIIDGNSHKAIEFVPEVAALDRTSPDPEETLEQKNQTGVTPHLV